MNIYIKCIARLSHIYINKTKPIVIWITWSVWKTSARMIIYQTLQTIFPKANIYTSPKNFNWEIWTALSIFQIEKFGPSPWLFVKTIFYMIYNIIFSKPSYDIILIEYGIDHVWEMDLQLSIAKPDISIWTWVDVVHSANYPSNDPSYIATEKAKLPQNTKKIVYINQADKYCRKYANTIKTDLFMFDTDNASIDKPSDIDIIHNLTWSHNISYIYIWTSIAEIISYQWLLWSKSSQLQTEYKIDYNLQSWRYTMLNWINNSIIVDSSYNGAPASMRATINQFLEDILDKYSDHKIILVLWEMRELGNLSQWEHESLIQYIYELTTQKTHQYHIDIIDNLTLVLVSWDITKYGSSKADELWFKYILFDNSIETGKRLNSHITKDTQNKYAILFKSSQWQIYLEEAIKYILADKSDYDKLPRQDSERQKKKKSQSKWAQ